jgi:hypothetical protein
MRRRVKGNIASRDVTCDMGDVKHLCEEIFHSMGKEESRPFCEHLMNLENVYYARNARSDNTVDLITVSLGGVESDNDSNEEDNSSETQENKMGDIALLTGNNG